MSTLEAQMTHAAWDAALPYDMEDEARRNPFHCRAYGAVRG